MGRFCTVLQLSMQVRYDWLDVNNMIRKHSRYPLVIFGLVAALALTACASGDDGATPTAPPDVQGGAVISNFVLPNLTLSVGDTVEWTNQDSASHTTTSGTGGRFDDIGWNSPTLSTGESFSHTFDQAGTFTYTCRIHPSMSGTITVSTGEAALSLPSSSPSSGLDGYDY